jgi:enoyl-CoA hydratase/carnithine racemase
MSMTPSLELSHEGRVARITLNRPDKRNALTSEMCSGIVDAVENAHGDDTIGAVLIDAKGDVFCAGMDLDDATAADAVERTAVHERLFTLGARSRKPIVAAIQGPALGGGVGLICNAHVAIAAHGSSFGLTEIRIGMWPFVIYRSVAIALGERRALELSMMGRIFNVPEAVQWGLIHEATPIFELDDRATAIATHLAESSPQAMSAGLEFVQKTHGLDPVSAASIALEMRKHTFAASEFREGVAAFREKRRPKFITPTAGT